MEAISCMVLHWSSLACLRSTPFHLGLALCCHASITFNIWTEISSYCTTLQIHRLHPVQATRAFRTDTAHYKRILVGIKIWNCITSKGYIPIPETNIGLSHKYDLWRCLRAICIAEERISRDFVLVKAWSPTQPCYASFFFRCALVSMMPCFYESGKDTVCIKRNYYARVPASSRQALANLPHFSFSKNICNLQTLYCTYDGIFQLLFWLLEKKKKKKQPTQKILSRCKSDTSPSYFKT